MMALVRGRETFESRILVPAKPADLAMLGGFWVCALVSRLGRAPGWEEASLVFVLLGVLPLALRTAAQRLRSQPLSLLADFSPAFALFLAYGNLDPVLDAFHVPLADARLQMLDQRIFGMQPSIALAPHLTGWESNLLMLCYVSYYLWPVLLGALLWAFRGEAAFDRWSLAVMVILLLNFALYAAVPAVGPRFAQAESFAVPVVGDVAAPLFRAFMRSPFHRDCFPSGHTAMSLMVLWHAFRKLRPFFWVALLPCAGLIVATVALRFHYGVDLLAAPPLTIVGYALSGRIYAAAPRGVALLAES